MPGEGGGDPHITTLDGTRFDFRGEPGELYDLLMAHNLGVRCTVADLPGSDAQAFDRLVIHLPGDVTIVISPRYTVVHTPDHEVHVKQDPGHAEHEGDVYPDPLLGDRPHLDFEHRPKIPLLATCTSGLMVDGHRRPAADFRTGERWPSE